MPFASIELDILNINPTTKYFKIRVNPIFQFKLAKEREDKELVFLNQRGLEIRGTIDDRLYFYSNIVESQARFANYVETVIEKSKAVPYNGFYKTFFSSLFKVENGYDFLNSQAYIGFNATKHIGIQFGYAKNFIGDGYRSMFLSDFADNYLHLKINTNIGRVNYQNIFAELLGFRFLMYEDISERGGCVPDKGGPIEGDQQPPY